MKEDTLFQFVGFETAVNLDDFSSQWENFAKKFFKQDIHHITLQQQIKSRNRFKFVSMNEWPQDNFRFSFMENRGSDYFPDHRVKVVQAGGYMPVHLEDENHVHDETKVLVFIHEDHLGEKELKRFPHHFLNVYQAFYQSCQYSHVLEFYAENEYALDLFERLKKRFSHCDIGMYKECMVLDG